MLWSVFLSRFEEMFHGDKSKEVDCQEVRTVGQEARLRSQAQHARKRPKGCKKTQCSAQAARAGTRGEGSCPRQARYQRSCPASLGRGFRGGRESQRPWGESGRPRAVELLILRLAGVMT